MEKERLERAIAHNGLASRREAKDMIKRGQVTVNGEVINEPGYLITPEVDRIELAEDTLKVKESVLVYKPRGIETSATTPGAQDLHTYFPQYRHLAPIGRLDKDSEGLIIMSNDGTLTAALTKVGTMVGKTYQVTVREHASEAALQKMSKGIMIDSVMTKPATVKHISRTSFVITLHEGRKHQIRRMCDACRLTIESLVRTSIGSLEMGDMEPGDARELSKEEIAGLKGK